MESSGDKTCKWLLAVDDGYAIEMSFASFDVSSSRPVTKTISYELNTLHFKIADCSTGSVKVYDGSDTSATLLGTFCGTNIPTVLTSGDKNLYIVYTSTSTSSSFNAPWNKVTSKFEMKYIAL